MAKKEMLFGIIDPVAKSAKVKKFASFDDALDAAGLKPGEIDFGQLGPGLSIVVYEYGLFVPMAQTAYFAISGRLFAGTALIHAINEMGETVSLSSKTFPVDITYFEDGAAALRAIEADEIAQPSIAIGKETIWVWPQPAPEGMLKGGTK